MQMTSFGFATANASRSPAGSLTTREQVTWVAPPTVARS